MKMNINIPGLAAMLEQTAALRCAVLDARKRLQSDAIGTSVKQGKFRVQLCLEKNNGSSTIIPLSDYVSMQQAIEFLKSYQD